MKKEAPNPAKNQSKVVEKEEDLLGFMDRVLWNVVRGLFLEQCSTKA